MCLQSNSLLHRELLAFPYDWSLFFATLGLYAFHRLIGLRRINLSEHVGRYNVIDRLSGFILLIAIVSTATSVYFFWQTPNLIKWGVIIPGLLSISYILPIFKNGGRLRDFHFIKIFVIVVAWAWLTVFIPYLNHSTIGFKELILLLLERSFFIFAITLPFDIRDLNIDAKTQVKTLPALLGLATTKKLAYLSLGLMTVCILWNYFEGIYTFSNIIALFISICTAVILVAYSKPLLPDQYFTGLVDGLIVFQALLFLFTVR